MRTLFSPLGLSKGTLYTAIIHTKPDHVVVITSSQGAELVDEIVSKTKEDYEREFTVEVHKISDPFTAFIEGRELARHLVDRGRDENIINIAGGTTALQDAIQCLARLLNAKEVAVVDRRSVQEQRENPYVGGELIEVPLIEG